VSTFAANPAGLPHVSPCTVERANQSLPTRNDGGGRHPSCGGYACSNRVSMVANFRSQCASENFALARVCRYVSRLLLGHSFGAYLAPGGTRSFASRPFGVSVPPETSLRTTAKSASQISFGLLRESRPSALGSRAHSVRPPTIGEFNKRRYHHVPEQSNPHRLPR
jgi:hypothetical protein